MRKHYFIHLFSLLCLIAANASAQNIDTTTLNTLFKTIEHNDEGSGSVAVLKDGELIYQNAYGFADYTNQIKANPQTKFRIGSITKTFTASLIMAAIEEGKLTLDTKLSKFYPDFHQSEQITIANLLRHRSGLYNFTNAPEYALYMNQEKSKAEMLEIMRKNENTFEPGAKHEYSNTGYVLLTFILEDIYDIPFETLLKQRIIKPLDLERTSFEATINASNNEAYSYAKTTEWLKVPETNMTVPLGAGAISSTALATSQFFNALFNNEVVNEESLSQMTQMEDNYGFGLFKMPYNDRWLIGHTGGIDGFQSVTCYYPEDKLTITILCNAVSYSRNEILIAILSSYFDDPFEVPDFKDAITLTKPQIAPYAGVYKSDDFPLDITISVEENQLLAQATGQSAFPLSPVDESTFVFKAAGIKIVFNKEKETLTLNQAGRSFILYKQ